MHRVATEAGGLDLERSLQSINRVSVDGATQCRSRMGHTEYCLVVGIEFQVVSNAVSTFIQMTLGAHINGEMTIL